MGKNKVEMVGGIAVEFVGGDKPLKAPTHTFIKYPTSKIPQSEITRYCDKMRELLGLSKGHPVYVDANVDTTHYQYSTSQMVRIKLSAKIGDHVVVAGVTNYGLGFNAWWDGAYNLGQGDCPKQLILTLSRFPDGWKK